MVAERTIPPSIGNQTHIIQPVANNYTNKQEVTVHDETSQCYEHIRTSTGEKRRSTAVAETTSTKTEQAWNGFYLAADNKLIFL